MIDTEINAAATAIPTLCSFNKLEIIIIMCEELIHNSAIKILPVMHIFKYWYIVAKMYLE